MDLNPWVFRRMSTTMPPACPLRAGAFQVMGIQLL